MPDTLLVILSLLPIPSAMVSLYLILIPCPSNRAQSTAVLVLVATIAACGLANLVTGDTILGVLSITIAALIMLIAAREKHLAARRDGQQTKQ
ncbi:hypothetical protein ACFXJO_03465 [Streptomyces lavendulae]|uniref:hypothetical protein n=1 Tax=Streptomyces lavendulae TaxID=1914 RepID=UPI00368C03F9